MFHTTNQDPGPGDDSAFSNAGSGAPGFGRRVFIRFADAGHRFVTGRLAAALLMLVTATALTAATATNAPSGPAQSIGIEGREVSELPRPDYLAKPLDDRTELILRIEKTEPAAGGKTRYHFHYIGLEPGSYPLANYLIRPDGSRPDEIGNAQLHVRAMLPEDHNGQLNAYVPRPFPFIGGYRALLATLAVVWVCGFVAYGVLTRKKKAPAAVEVVVPEPTFAERLRPLVEAAAAGQLNTAGQADLERLLMGFWRDKLELPEMRMAEALSRLKAHAEAGAILRAVERWLHQPGGAALREIAPLLQPYRSAPESAGAAMKGEGA